MASPRVGDGRARPTTPARSRAAGGSGAAPTSDMGHLPGDEDSPRPGLDVGHLVGPWLGRAGLWGTEAQPCCCGAAGAEAEGCGGLTWGPGPWGGGGSAGG